MCIPIFAGIGVAMGAAAGSATAAAVGTTVVAATVASAALSATAAYQSGQSQKKAGEYNAKVQRDAANAATERGSIMASDERDRARKVAGIQRSQLAAGNTNISTGSALDLLTETAGMGELNALRAVNNAQREAYGLNASAELETYKGNAAARAGTLSAAGGMLSAAGGAFSSYARFR